MAGGFRKGLDIEELVYSGVCGAFMEVFSIGPKAIFALAIAVEVLWDFKMGEYPSIGGSMSILIRTRMQEFPSWVQDSAECIMQIAFALLAPTTGMK
jgi:hypothetical protein